MCTVKEDKLRSLMQNMGGVLVAYSGGVDSSYLALIATQELGSRAVCMTGVSASVSSFQLECAERIASDNDFRHLLIKTDELKDESYRENSGNRCYFCKSELYSKIAGMAAERFAGYSIIDGTNADDVRDIRPGRVAASELNVRSPLVELGITKDDIRTLSKKHGLETWDKPASPCLSSRVATGVPVTIERLGKVERGETILRDTGFREYRLRVDGEHARIDISSAEMKGSDFNDRIESSSKKIKKLGFKSVSLNLDGFRSGSMNDVSKGPQIRQLAV